MNGREKQMLELSVRKRYICIDFFQFFSRSASGKNAMRSTDP